MYKGSYEKINAWSVTRVFDLLMTHNNVMYNIYDVLWWGMLSFDQWEDKVLGKLPVRAQQ